jgi:alkylation response protein AidB-like acyl-CoA dehydrogenase
MHEAILLEELGRAMAPAVWRRAYVVRAIDRFGTEEQRQRFIRPALDGEEGWCQGYSEPDAGSDLAAVRTRAVLDGEDYVVTGQKVWTSEAHRSRWCMLLARTDPEAPKHAGLTCLIVDLETPGVEVRPFRQLTGALEFAEVFFDGARVPVENVLGRPGGGWEVINDTLALERGAADIGYLSDFQRLVGEAAEKVKAADGALDAHIPALGRAAVAVEVLRLRVLESLAARQAGTDGIADASVDKLMMTEAEQLLTSAMFDMQSAGAVIGTAPDRVEQYLWSRSSSIAGGTSQIQRTIVATRILGAPRG